MGKKPVIVGVSGASASGKTLLSNTIFDELGSRDVVVIPQDAYYRNNTHLSFEERGKVNYDHPDAFETDLLCQHLDMIVRGEEVSIPVYDFNEHLRSKETLDIGQHKIIVLEGILLFAETMLRDRIDICIFMDTALDICLIRRIRRDVIERGRTLPSVLEQYEKTVRPMYYQFIEPSKRYADIIIPRGGENRIAIDMIKTKLRSVLRNS